VALQLDIEAVANARRILGQRRARLLDLAAAEQRIDRPVRSARQQDQPLGVLATLPTAHAVLGRVASR
jgi:hypothetical protein